MEGFGLEIRIGVDECEAFYAKVMEMLLYDIAVRDCYIC